MNQFSYNYSAPEFIIYKFIRFIFYLYVSFNDSNTRGTSAIIAVLDPFRGCHCHWLEAHKSQSAHSILAIYAYLSYRNYNIILRKYRILLLQHSQHNNSRGLAKIIAHLISFVCYTF